MLRLKLLDLNVDLVNVGFDGSGDDGDVGDIEFETANGYLSNDAANQVLDHNDYKLLRDWAYFVICRNVDKVGDWVNNEGGYGQIHWDVKRNEVELAYCQRTVEEHDWQFEI
tara:strand:+ start:694 stop:1029 length:336 start_codon:yes stop_codon:yes gene_type:complete